MSKKIISKRITLYGKAKRGVERYSGDKRVLIKPHSRKVVKIINGRKVKVITKVKPYMKSNKGMIKRIKKS